MGTPEKTEGAWDSRRLAVWAGELIAVPGDFAEVGAYKGQSFAHLARLAAAHGRTAHAFDSFLGMADPGPRDGPVYPRGRLSVGGLAAFARRMDAASVPAGSYYLHGGYVPDCFRGAAALHLALCIVDLDHYEPTVQAIAWAWEHLSPGGYLCLDDYFPGRDTYASGAIGEWLAAEPRDVVWHCNAQLVARR